MPRNPEITTQEQLLNAYIEVSAKVKTLESVIAQQQSRQFTCFNVEYDPAPDKTFTTSVYYYQITKAWSAELYRYVTVAGRIKLNGNSSIVINRVELQQQTDWGFAPISVGLMSMDYSDVDGDFEFNPVLSGTNFDATYRAGYCYFGFNVQGAFTRLRVALMGNNQPISDDASSLNVFVVMQY
jgi:hypothetical protein